MPAMCFGSDLSRLNWLFAPSLSWPLRLSLFSPTNCFAPAPNAARRSLFETSRLSDARTVSLPVSAAVAQRSM